MTPLTIVLCFPVESHHVEQIRRTVPEFTVIPAEQHEIGRTIFQADLFCGHAKQPIDWPAVVAAGRLQWIQSSAAGLDHCLHPAVIESNIPVTSASGLFANQVAEQTFALLFGLIRSTPAFFQATLERKYERLATDDLHGKTIGIVGLGGNGLRIAEMLAPLGNRILATDYWPRRKPSFVEELWSADRLPELLAQSDVVILCIPWNEQTHHLINAETIAHMKPGSYLINVARGQVVDEPALIAALQAGKIKAAGLDVAEVEPLPSDSPLWTMPRVMITPHVGAQSHRRVSDTVDFFCQNLLRYVQQKPLKNLVDKRLGFPGMED
ncbi:MAG: D-2-hydroxyacid dehydrogenase [Planctomycetaceae bacterium]|nr:D-2-hydroxyacid dehydrogenase [Planctomycetaceae bacterium]